MKSPPVQHHDDEARDLTQAFIDGDPEAYRTLTGALIDQDILTPVPGR